MPLFRFSFLSPCLGTALAMVLPCQGQALPVPTVIPVANVDIETLPGHTYTLQRSPDMESWTDAGRLFGTGTGVSFSLEALGGAEYLRVRDDTRPAGGLAPWDLAGQTITFSREDGTHTWQFLAGNTGSLVPPGGAAAQAFTWTWLRTGENEGRVTTEFAGRTEQLQLAWTRAALGRIEQQVRIGGIVQQSCSGCFHTGAPVDPVSGSQLTAAHLLFSENGSADLISRSGTGPAATWSLARNDSSSGCTLDLSGNAISLTLPDGSIDIISLTFTGPSTGTFSRQTVRNGLFLDTDAGVFCAVP